MLTVTMNNPNFCEDKRSYSVKEIAQILGISERTAYNFCRDTNDFKVINVGRLVRIHKDSFDNWFDSVCN